MVQSSPQHKEIMLNHLRLGHPNFMYLKRLFLSLFLNKNTSSIQCDMCEFAKHSRSSYHLTSYKASFPFATIHSDILGPSKVPNITGARWFVLFVDDHTRLSWVYMMKHKSETAKLFKTFHKMIKLNSTQPFRSSIQIMPEIILT